MFYRKGKPFCFEVMWLRDKTCEDVVKESWVEVHDPSLVSVLSNKIFTCQDNLRTWNRETFGHV